MKKIINMVALVITLSAYGQMQKTRFQDITGLWEVVGEHGAALNIVDSSALEFTYMGEKKMIRNYSIDLSKSPCWLDFSVADSSSAFKVKSLVQKVGDDVLKWQLFVDEDRSPYFTTGRGEVFYLRKAKPAQGAMAAVQ